MCKIDGSKQIRAGNIWNIFEAIEHMEVSIFRGSCFINHPFGGIPIYGHLHIYIYIYIPVKAQQETALSQRLQWSLPPCRLRVHRAKLPAPWQRCFRCFTWFTWLSTHLEYICINIFESIYNIYTHNILMIVRIKILYNMYIHPYCILDLSQAYTKWISLLVWTPSHGATYAGRFHRTDDLGNDGAPWVFLGKPSGTLQHHGGSLKPKNTFSTTEVEKKHTWLVVWLPFFMFPYIGNNHPNWLIFFRGVQTTNQIRIISNLGNDESDIDQPLKLLEETGWIVYYKMNLWSGGCNRTRWSIFWVR